MLLIFNIFYLIEVNFQDDDLIKDQSLKKLNISKSVRNKKLKKSQSEEFSEMMINLKTLKAQYGNLKIPDLSEFNNGGNDDQEETSLTFEEQCQLTEANIIAVDLFDLINQHIGLFVEQNSEFVFEKEFSSFKQKLATVQHQPKIITLCKLAAQEKSPPEKIQLWFAVSMTLFVTGQIEDDDFIEMKQQMMNEMKRISAKNSINRFDINHLFVVFYFVVQQLVEHFQNWRQLPWIANSPKLTKSMFKKLERVYDQAWEKLFDTMVDMLQFTKTDNVCTITEQCNYK